MAPLLATWSHILKAFGAFSRSLGHTFWSFGNFCESTCNFQIWFWALLRDFAFRCLQYLEFWISQIVTRVAKSAYNKRKRSLVWRLFCASKFFGFQDSCPSSIWRGLSELSETAHFIQETQNAFPPPTTTTTEDLFQRFSGSRKPAFLISGQEITFINSLAPLKAS